MSSSAGLGKSGAGMRPARPPAVLTPHDLRNTPGAAWSAVVDGPLTPSTHAAPRTRDGSPESLLHAARLHTTRRLVGGSPQSVRGARSPGAAADSAGDVDGDGRSWRGAAAEVDGDLEGAMGANQARRTHLMHSFSEELLREQGALQAHAAAHPFPSGGCAEGSPGAGESHSCISCWCTGASSGDSSCSRSRATQLSTSRSWSRVCDAVEEYELSPSPLSPAGRAARELRRIRRDRPPIQMDALVAVGLDHGLGDLTQPRTQRGSSRRSPLHTPSPELHHSRGRGKGASSTRNTPVGSSSGGRAHARHGRGGGGTVGSGGAGGGTGGGTGGILPGSPAGASVDLLASHAAEMHQVALNRYKYRRRMEELLEHTQGQGPGFLCARTPPHGQTCRGHGLCSHAFDPRRVTVVTPSWLARVANAPA